MHSITRLRGAYDALQTGVRLSYHPELASAEIFRFHTALLEAEPSVGTLKPVFLDRMSKGSNRISSASPGSTEFEAQKQKRLDTFKRAELLVAEARK